MGQADAGSAAVVCKRDTGAAGRREDAEAFAAGGQVLRGLPVLQRHADLVSLRRVGCDGDPSVDFRRGVLRAL